MRTPPAPAAHPSAPAATPQPLLPPQSLLPLLSPPLPLPSPPLPLPHHHLSSGLWSFLFPSSLLRPLGDSETSSLQRSWLAWGQEPYIPINLTSCFQEKLGRGVELSNRPSERLS